MDNKEKLLSSEDNQQESKKNNINKIIVICCILLAVILIVSYMFFSNKGDYGAGTISSSSNTSQTGSSGTTTEIPTSDETTPRTSETTDKTGSSEPLSQDSLPTDPRYTNTQLTAPTTMRPHDLEAPNLASPEEGEPSFLAQTFVSGLFTLCIRPDNSYNKQFHDNMEHLATPEMVKQGIGSWANGESLAWKVSANSDRCNMMTAYPEVTRSNIINSNTIEYTIDVPSSLRTYDARGGTQSQNLPTFTAIVEMNYIDGKWLVSNFSIKGGVLPDLH